MKQIFKCFIKTLAPLHIGCDEVYEPIGFVVDENRNELTAFDPISFISQMNENDKKRFSEICSKGSIESILEIYKFLRRRSAVGKSVQLCAGFIRHYNDTLSTDKKEIKDKLNKFVISRTSFLSADDRPYIPGSSVKGSLRTAYLNRLEQSQHIPTPGGRYAASDLEKKLLSYSDIHNDPFRLVKVSDFIPVGEIKTRIVYAVNIKKESGGAAKGPFQIVETVVPETVFCGKIVAEKPLIEGSVKKPIQLEALLQSSRTFYSKEHNREQKELRTVGIAVSDALFTKGGIPIRIGRHSGAESVTVEGHRNIKIMAKRRENTRFDDHATTFWLASEESKPEIVTHCKPFGWAELCEIMPLHEQEFEKKEKEWEENNSVRKTTVFIQNNSWLSKKSAIQESPSSPKKVLEPEIWENAIISLVPNTGEITAFFGNKKAVSKDKSIAPESILEKLKKKKKSITANVKVEPYGNSFRLLKILEENK